MPVYPARMQQTERRRAFSKSLLGQMILTTVVPAALVLMSIIAFLAYRTYLTILEEQKVVLQGNAKSIADWIDGRQREGFNTAEMLAAGQEAGLFGKRDLSVRTMRKALELNPDATGISMTYEPNADGNDATDPKGRFVPYWFRDWKNGERIAFKATVGMEDSLFYQGPKKQWETAHVETAMMTEPYDYDGRQMVEHACPIVIDGKFVGAITVDCALSDLQRELDREARETEVDVYVVSAQERIVLVSSGTHRAFRTKAESWRTKRMEETESAEMLALMVKERDEDVIHELEDPATGDRSFFASAPVGASKWTVVVSVAESSVTGPLWRNNFATAGVACVMIALISVVIFIPTRRLSQRIKLAADAAQQVAAGDLTRPATNSTIPNEVGDLLRALDSMNADLNSLVGHVRTASVELNSTSTELASTSRQQEEVVASFGASSAQVAAAVREITLTGQELSREMEHVNSIASATATLAAEGRGQLEAMESAMKSLDTATANVAERLAAINEKAVIIGSVVTTITKVAEQTNLLSVNAAIEAEKAGEYGRGFLVVAREIRRLADQTAQATLDIERMVEEMQGAVSTGVMEMDRFSDQVRRNVGDTRTISRSMSEIIGSVDQANRSFGTVREGMQSQATGAAQIAEAMTTLSSNAKSSGEAVREFSRATLALNRSISVLKEAIAVFMLRS